MYGDEDIVEKPVSTVLYRQSSVETSDEILKNQPTDVYSLVDYTKKSSKKSVGYDSRQTSTEQHFIVDADKRQQVLKSIGVDDGLSSVGYMPGRLNNSVHVCNRNYTNY